MEKPAITDYPLHELIRKRWSPRAFADREVEGETILTVLEAARWAPSCFNEQPWRFLIAMRDDPTEHDRMLECLVEFNRNWAKAAPVLMISVASLQFGRNGKDNRHGIHDVGLATENLILQATALGLVAHAMAGFDVGKARETYGIPETCEPVAAIALGYPGEPEQLDEELRARELEPRERRALTDFVFTGTWGEQAPML
jgi:nitroreductase